MGVSLARISLLIAGLAGGILFVCRRSRVVRTGRGRSHPLRLIAWLTLLYYLLLTFLCPFFPWEIDVRYEVILLAGTFIWLIHRERLPGTERSPRRLSGPAIRDPGTPRGRGDRPGECPAR